MAQYVPLELKVDDPEFQQWVQRYPPTGKGIPMIFIVSAQGQQVYNNSGAPHGDGLKQLLQAGIEQTGGVKDLSKVADGKKTPRDRRKTRIIAQRAKRLLANEEYTSAMTSLKPYLEDPPEELAGLISDLTQKARSGVSRAAARTKEGDKPLLGALALVKIDRQFGALPDLQAELKAALKDAPADLVERARAIDKGRIWEEKKIRRAALAAYRKVVEAYPDTFAAQLCAERVAKLDRRPASDGKTRIWTDSTGKHKIEARLVSVTNDAVELEKADGAHISVPLAKLSKEDQEFVRSKS